MRYEYIREREREREKEAKKGYMTEANESYVKVQQQHQRGNAFLQHE